MITLGQIEHTSVYANRKKFVRIKDGSNDQTKWLTELIDRSL
jgi:hypothetical protein